MKRNPEIQAGALQFVVFTSVVIAILLAAFISLVHVHTFFKKQAHSVSKTVKAADEGVHYALRNTIGINDTVTGGIPAKNEYAIRLYKHYWGVFEHVTSTAHFGNKKFTKTALTGGQYSREDRTALYVQDQNKSLIVVGNTRIEGNVRLPEKTVRPGNIAGTGYYGDQLVYGKIKKSQVQMPVLPPELLSYLDRMIQQQFDFEEDKIISPFPDKPLANSFTRPVVYVYSDGSSVLHEVTLSGNIIVYAEKKIVIPVSSQLRDIVLVAPEIEIHDGVSGNFHAIASQHIAVGKNVVLHYPSSLILKEQTHQHTIAKEHPQIIIDEHTVIKGAVLFLGKEKKDNFLAQVVVAPHAIICGELYCDQNLNLNGTVHGSVYTSNFIESHLGTTYQNHLLNGIISGNSLPEAYAGFSWTEAKKGIVKWLY